MLNIDEPIMVTIYILLGYKQNSKQSWQFVSRALMSYKWIRIRTQNIAKASHAYRDRLIIS